MTSGRQTKGTSDWQWTSSVEEFLTYLTGVPRPSQDVAWCHNCLHVNAIFWGCFSELLSIVDWDHKCKCIRTKLLSPCFLTTAKVFVARTGKVSLVHGVVPHYRRWCSLLWCLLAFVSVQVPLISCSTCSTKLLFFQKALAVVVIVEFVHIQEWREGAYARDELNIWANAPSPLLSTSSVQKVGTYFRELTVHRMCCSYWGNVGATLPQ